MKINEYKENDDESKSEFIKNLIDQGTSKEEAEKRWNICMNINLPQSIFDDLEKLKEILK